MTTPLRDDALATSPVLRLDGLSVDIKGSPADRSTPARRVVDRVSFTVRPGERVALVGASGSGKTLTALAIAGLLPNGVVQGAGTITLGTSSPSHGDLAATPLRTAMVFQDARAALQPIRRIGKQLDDVLRYAPSTTSNGTVHALTRAQRKAAAISLLHEVGLTDTTRIRRAFPAQLSGGMCQRVLIALALARAPDLLLADEPTTGLDAANQARVMALIEQSARARNAAVLLITHDLPLAVAHCDRIVVMRAGRCVEVLDAATLGTSARHRYTRTLWAAHRLPAFASSYATPEAPRPLVDRNVPPPAIDHSTTDRRPTLIVDAVEKGYGARFRRHTPVLQNVGLSVQRGEIVGLAGPSGGGKTTLGRIIARLALQDSGRVIWNAIDLSATGPIAAAKTPWRHAIQYVHQDARGSLDPLRTVGDIVAAANEGLPDRRGGAIDIDAALREVALPAALRHRFVHQLSGGEASRVALARALARQPALLILDEPTAALDTLSRARILRLIHRLAQAHGLTVLCISHDLDALQTLCDRVVTLENGSLTAQFND